MEAGTVKPGEWLLVESIDRLSREKISEAEDLIKRILSAGITIATLSPSDSSPRQPRTTYWRGSRSSCWQAGLTRSLRRSPGEAKMSGRRQGNGGHCRAAQDDGELPGMVAACPPTGRSGRRSRRQWHSSVDLSSLIAGHGAGDI